MAPPPTPEPPLEVVEAALDVAKLGETWSRVLPPDGVPSRPLAATATATTRAK
jgi:hypothetical protein